jgi:hypothetical protein
MVDYIHRSQPKALCLRILPGSTTPWVFLALLQIRTGRPCERMASASDSQRVRADEESLP